MLRPRAATWGCTILLAGGCAPALREPPTLAELSGKTAPIPAEMAEEQAARAAARFGERTLEAVREAARLWTEVAEAEGTRVDAVIEAARARIWLADHETAADRRREESTLAVQTAQWCERRAPGQPACAYWLGAALGVQARERRATALEALPAIVELFERAAELAPLVDEAGPDRALALLYVRAPGWPAGPGDPETGLEHARRAVELRPEHPPNLLALGEALAATGDPEGSHRAFDRALELARERETEGVPEAVEWRREAEGRLDRDTSLGLRSVPVLG